jgi:hypothetical protein
MFSCISTWKLSDVRRYTVVPKWKTESTWFFSNGVIMHSYQKGGYLCMVQDKIYESSLYDEIKGKLVTVDHHSV